MILKRNVLKFVCENNKRIIYMPNIAAKKLEKIIL